MRKAILVMGLILAVAPLSGGGRPGGADGAHSRNPVVGSARKGDAAAVRRLLDAGVDPNTRFRYDATALSYACDRGHVEVVRLLLERGAEVNVKDTFYGATPLSWAISPAQGRRPRMTRSFACSWRVVPTAWLPAPSRPRAAGSSWRWASFSTA